jgi:hypothetical protein
MNNGMNNGMNTTRRALVLAGMVLAVMIGTGIPASATFADSAAIPTMSVTTGTVAAPIQQEAIGWCTTTVDPVTGVATTTVHAKIEWWRSASPRVTGYRVTAHLNDGTSYVMATTDATADEVFGNPPHAYLQYQPRFTVTTLTAYGWTAESARSNVLTC